MEHFRDEQITCNTCGLSFLFSAAEASVYAARRLAAPPKRCKNCRKARKEQLGAPPGDAGRGGPQQARGRQYTGDVNEYRSPMQDVFPSPMPASHGDRRAHPRGLGRRPMDDGEYRSPSFPNERGRGAARNPAARPWPESSTKPTATRYRITCKACGADAEVPFKPAEGRDLFCQPCYRARRAAAT